MVNNGWQYRNLLNIYFIDCFEKKDNFGVTSGYKKGDNDD